MANYGLVVEGVYDSHIYPALLRRLDPTMGQVIVRIMGGIAALKREFPVMLRDLEHAIDSGPVDRVFVIRDADGRDPIALEQQLRARVVGQQYAFPSGHDVHCVVQAVESWLLADVDAISACAIARGGSRLEARENVPDAIETVLDPKRLLNRVLCAAALPLTAPVGAAIAEALDLERVRARCPSFVRWEAKIKA